MNVVLFGNPELLFRWSREDITGRTIRNKNSERTLFVVEAPVAIPLGADVFNTFSDIEKWHVRITRVLLLDRELSYTRKRVPAVGAGMRGQISEEINQAGPRILEEEALQRNIPVVEIPHKSIGESIERFLISIPQSSEKMTSNLVPNCSVVSSFFI